jgi:hypothetical protein
VSPDGRWAYTLYDGAGAQPFVHALDTMGRTAVCIDLPGLAGRQDLYELRLGVGSGGGGLTVEKSGKPIVLIDPETFRVSEAAESVPRDLRGIEVAEAPASAALSPAAQLSAPTLGLGRTDRPVKTSTPWRAIAAGTLGGLLATALLVARRQRRVAGPPAVTRADR